MSPLQKTRSAILAIHCADQEGIVATVTEFVYKNGGNILFLDQHVDQTNKVFFMRIEWDLSNFSIPHLKIYESFKTLIGDRYEMNFSLNFSDEQPRMAVFVSRYNHCLYDIIARWHGNEWAINFPVIISNHPDLKPLADQFGIDFRYIPVDHDTHEEAEKAAIDILTEYKIDFIVLARYMQILSPHFIAQYQNRIINIHHSFLPAFPGSKPYHSAYERGVKIIGATCHYVSNELDAGPIIEQDVIRVSHSDSVEDLIRKGRDLEKVVLSRGIWQHINHRTLVHKNRTVVFS